MGSDSSKHAREPLSDLVSRQLERTTKCKITRQRNICFDFVEEIELKFCIFFFIYIKKQNQK